MAEILISQIKYWTEQKKNYQSNLENGIGHAESITALIGEIDARIRKLSCELDKIQNASASSSSSSSSSSANPSHQRSYRSSMSTTNLAEPEDIETRIDPVAKKVIDKTFFGCKIS